jgi:outer membrane protein
VPQLPTRLAAGEVMTLGELVDLALSRNPETRIAYAQARAAAADLSFARSAYLPEVDLDASLSHAKQAALGGRTTVDQTTYGPSLTLSYLLFDFGGRGGRLDVAHEALVAATASHNAAIQDVTLQVEEAYYDLLAAQAGVVAATAMLKETEQALHAAESRRDSGVATIAEVLQTRTANAQALLSLQRLQGQELGLRGVLATSLGLQATTPIAIGQLPEGLSVQTAAEKVEVFIARALELRPDLAAARAQALAAEARVSVARAGAFPSLGLTGTANRQYYSPHPYESYSDNWSAQLLLRIPLFDGFASIFAARRARADAEAAALRAESMERQVSLQVWMSFHDLETAAQSLTTAGALLVSAEQSERVAMGRYQEGAGSLLDLLTAQAALAGARAAEIGARADWLRSVAHLAYSTGSLEPRKADDEADKP